MYSRFSKYVTLSKIAMAKVFAFFDWLNHWMNIKHFLHKLVWLKNSIKYVDENGKFYSLEIYKKLR